jgi:hypothetical protein
MEFNKATGLPSHPSILTGPLWGPGERLSAYVKCMCLTPLHSSAMKTSQWAGTVSHLSMYRLTPGMAQCSLNFTSVSRSQVFPD